VDRFWLDRYYETYGVAMVNPVSAFHTLSSGLYSHFDPDIIRKLPILFAVKVQGLSCE
jgi:hypothetical protein